MMNRQTPPTRTSISWMVVLKPFGPHHCCTCSGSVQAFQTRARGALIARCVTISRSLSDILISLLGLDGAHVRLEPVEARLPLRPQAPQPARHLVEPGRFQPAGAELGVAAAGDQARAFQH